MKTYGFAAALLLSGTAMLFRPAIAQWNYNDHVIDNIIQQRIEKRNMERRMKARRQKGKATKTTRRSSSAGASTKAKPRSATKATTSLPRHFIYIHRDTYQDFHMDDENGYEVTFRFAPTSGTSKPIVKKHTYSYLRNTEVASYKDLPPATYTITASAIYRGKNYPVHLGTKYGETTNPTGGNFAPSVRMTVKAAKDYYGDMTIQGFPDRIYLRVIE